MEMSAGLEFVNFVFIRDNEVEVSWQVGKRGHHLNCPLSDFAEKMHRVRVKCLRIDIEVDENVLRVLSESEIRVDNLNITIPSPASLLNLLVSAVQPEVFNYDVSCHENKNHYVDAVDLRDTVIDVSYLVIPAFVKSLELRAFEIIGFDITTLPPTVELFSTNDDVSTKQANQIMKQWQRGERNIETFNLFGKYSNENFSLDAALNGTDPKKVYMENFKNGKSDTFVIEGQNESLVVMAGEKKLVIYGPASVVNETYKNQLTPLIDNDNDKESNNNTINKLMDRPRDKIKN